MVVVLDSLSKTVDFGFRRSRVSGTAGSSFSNFWHPLHICGTDAERKFKFCVHKCTTGIYCLRIRNYDGMRRVSQNIIPCEKFTPMHKWKRGSVFLWCFVQQQHRGYAFHYVGVDLQLHRVHFSSSFFCFCKTVIFRSLDVYRVASSLTQCTTSCSS